MFIGDGYRDEVGEGRGVGFDGGAKKGGAGGRWWWIC